MEAIGLFLAIAAFLVLLDVTAQPAESDVV